MARIRTIKPDFWRHEGLSALPEATHLLAAALLNYADDEGYFNANPKLVQAECCPLRDPSVSIHDSLQQLMEIDYVKLGTAADGRRVGHILTFAEHQVINRKKPSKIKDERICWDASSTDPAPISDASHPEWKGKEQGTGNGTRGAAAPAGRYAFEGTVMRISHSDYALLVKDNPNIEIPSYLRARDAYLATQPEPERKRWWLSTLSDLRNKSSRAKQSGAGPPRQQSFDTDQFGGPIKEF